jgi:hypothetical protein
MSAGGTLRLFHCRPAAPAFDDTIRSAIVPDLVRRTGLEHVWAARQGPDDSGIRMVASLWSSFDAMDAALGAGASGDPPAEDHPGVGEPRSETFPVLRVIADDTPLEAGILRVARGVVRDMDADQYAGSVLEGVQEDLRDGHGPRALVVGRAGERAFVAVSAWTDWTHIEAATGATIRDPIRTRRRTELSSFEAQHLELLTARGSRRG